MALGRRLDVLGLQDIFDQVARFLVHFLLERTQDDGPEPVGRGLGLFLGHRFCPWLPMVLCKKAVLPGE